MFLTGILWTGTYWLQTRWPKKSEVSNLKKQWAKVTEMQSPWFCLLLMTASLLSIAGGQLDPAGQEEDPIKSCFCQLEGVLEDCPCEAAKVDAFNQDIQQQLSPLLHQPYFRYFQVCSFLAALAALYLPLSPTILGDCSGLYNITLMKMEKIA